VVAREVSEAHRRWDVVERLDGVVDPTVQGELMDRVDGLVEHLSRWYLVNRTRLDVATEVERGRPAFEELARLLGEDRTEAWRAMRERRLAALREQGVPEEAAREAAVIPELVYGPDVIAVAESTGRTIADVVEGFHLVGQRLYLDAVEERAAGLPTSSRWQRLAFRTIVDDLRLLRRQIVERVLATADGADVHRAVEGFLDARVDPYERLAALMESPASDGSDEASLVMVVVHQIRQVVSA
jgi:glutamate dehydrogenase